MDWDSRLHDLQLCFGVKDFLVCFNLTSMFFSAFVVCKIQ